MAAKLNFDTSNALIEAMTKAAGLGDPRPYQRVVLVLDANQVPKVYATKVMTADDVLRVILTLKGVEVVAESGDDAVEIVPLVVKG